MHSLSHHRHRSAGDESDKETKGLIGRGAGTTICTNGSLTSLCFGARCGV